LPASVARWCFTEDLKKETPYKNAGGQNYASVEAARLSTWYLCKQFLRRKVLADGAGSQPSLDKHIGDTFK